MEVSNAHKACLYVLLVPVFRACSVWAVVVWELMEKAGNVALSPAPIVKA